MKLKVIKQELFQQYFLQMTLLQSRNELCVTRDGWDQGSQATRSELAVL